MADHYPMNTSGIRIIQILNFTEGELAPTARIDPRQLVVDEGEAVEFHCMVTGTHYRGSTGHTGMTESFQSMPSSKTMS